MIKKFCLKVFVNVPLLYGHLVLLDLMIAALATWRNTEDYELWTDVVFASKYSDTVVSGILASLFFIALILFIGWMIFNLAIAYKHIGKVHYFVEFLKIGMKEKRNFSVFIFYLWFILQRLLIAVLIAIVGHASSLVLASLYLAIMVVSLLI